MSDAPVQLRACGSCSLCCKVMAVATFDKPKGRWCTHFAQGKGCTIHDRRPNECRIFQCGWTSNHALGEEWRPDRCKFILCVQNNGNLVIEADRDYLDAWKREPFYSQIKAWSDRQKMYYPLVYVLRRENMLVVFPEGEVDLGPVRDGAQVQWRYAVENGKRVPQAQWRDARGA